MRTNKILDRELKTLVNETKVTLLDIYTPDEINDLLSTVIWIEEIEDVARDANNPKRNTRGVPYNREGIPKVRTMLSLDNDIYQVILAYAKKKKTSLFTIIQYLISMGLKYEAEKVIENEKNN